MLSTIYTNVDCVDRTILWNNLEKITNNINLPWVFMGEFNDITTQLEKRDRKTNRNMANIFKDLLDYYSLADLVYTDIHELKCVETINLFNKGLIRSL